MCSVHDTELTAFQDVNPLTCGNAVTSKYLTSNQSTPVTLAWKFSILVKQIKKITSKKRKHSYN